MRRSTLAAISGTTFGLAGAVVGVMAARRSRLTLLDQVTHLPSDRLDFKEVAPGASLAALRGDPEKGPHAAFVRLSPGARFPLHTHPHETTLVVLKGAYLYGTDQGEIRVGPGDYLVVPGNLPHWSAGDATEGCLFFQQSPGRFDLNILH